MKRSLVRVAMGLMWGMIALGPAACGGDDSSGGSGQSASQTVSKEVSAASGGTVEGPGVKLVIPPGALSQDTTISIAVQDKAGYPGADTVASSVFEMGPDGLQFTKPVSLSIEFDGSNPPANATPKLAVLEGSDWKALADSAVSGSTVTAKTTHFSTFAVVWTSSGQVGGTCGDDFMACGGDFVGRWTYAAACATLPPNTNPYATACPTATYSPRIDVSGTVEFAADGQYRSDITLKMSAVLDFPKSCLPGGTSCDAIAGGNPVNDTGSACVVTYSEPEKTLSKTGVYQTDGTTVTFPDDSGNVTMDYCVEGSIAKFKDIEEDGTVWMYTLSRE